MQELYCIILMNGLFFVKVFLCFFTKIYKQMHLKGMSQIIKNNFNLVRKECLKLSRSSSEHRVKNEQKDINSWIIQISNAQTSRTKQDLKFSLVSEYCGSKFCRFYTTVNILRLCVCLKQVPLSRKHVRSWADPGALIKVCEAPFLWNICIRVNVPI